MLTLLKVMLALAATEALFMFFTTVLFFGVGIPVLLALVVF